MSRKRIEWTMPDQAAFELSEHEILLSFGDDWMGLAFYEWWNGEGNKTFEEWAKAHENDYLNY